MPTFRVICGNPSGQIVQLVIDAPDGVEARSIVQNAVTDDWAIGLVQLDPDDPKFVQMQDHIARQFNSTKLILNQQTKLIHRIEKKVFSHWTHALNIVAALVLFWIFAAFCIFLFGGFIASWFVIRH